MSKSKAFEDNKINVTYSVRKGENAGYHNVLKGLLFQSHCVVKSKSGRKHFGKGENFFTKALYFLQIGESQDYLCQ